MSFDAMAADVLALLDKQGIKQAVLCGHSLGGKVAMALALARPERIERLIVLDIAPVSYDTHDGSCWNEIHQVVRAMRSIDLERVRSKTDADAVLARTISDPGLRAFVLTNMLRDQNGRFRWRINLPVISQKLDELAGWEAPAAEPYGGNALFVSGGKSQYVRSLHLPAISELFRRFSVTTLRGAAHWVHADEPESLRLIVLKFLQAPSA
uniref:AB hydrolase-1 domain-containing protein n=1 Tax=Chrysotila carterae TaxID=13221 RepID=A0A7S4AZL5_CHRCT